MTTELRFFRIEPMMDRIPFDSDPAREWDLSLVGDTGVGFSVIDVAEDADVGVGSVGRSLLTKVPLVTFKPLVVTPFVAVAFGVLLPWAFSKDCSKASISCT